MKRMIKVLALAVICALMAPVALAQNITFSPGPHSLTLTPVAGGEALTTDVDALSYLGTDIEGTSYVMFGGALYSTPDEIFLGNGQIALQAMAPLKDGSSGDAVKAVQQALIQLGQLSGTADGFMGPKTIAAAETMIQQYGMPVGNGEVSALAQQLLMALTADPNAEPVVIAVGGSGEPVTLEEKFVAIADRTSVDLEPFAGEAYGFAYDEMTGRGEIRLTSQSTYALPAVAAIDEKSFVFSFGFSVAPEGASGVSLEPQIFLDSTGARRPFVRELIIKGEGVEPITLPVALIGSTIKGTSITESASAELSRELLPLLKNMADSGKLTLRIACKYQSFDYESTDMAANLHRFLTDWEAATAKLTEPEVQ